MEYTKATWEYDWVIDEDIGIREVLIITNEQGDINDN